MTKRKLKVLCLNFEDAGVGSSGLLAAEALSEHPDLDVHYLYDAAAAQSPLQRKRIQKMPGLAVKARSFRHRLTAYLSILFYCGKFRPDVVHDFSGSAYRKNSPLWPFFALFSRLVFTEPSPSTQPFAKLANRLIRQLAYKVGHHFIVFGPQSHQALLQSGVSGQKIFQSRLGHKGFYAETIPRPPRRDPNTILFFGEFRPGKGMDLLLPIADAVRRRFPSARFIVAGASAGESYYGTNWFQQSQKLLQSMRSRPDFEVREQYVADEAVAGFFGRAGMILLPYTEANQSGVLVTAMALECPVVATYAGDIPSAIRHGENGLLCANNADALAEAVLSLLASPERAKALAQQAKRDAEELFHWEKIVRDYPDKVYRG